MRIRIGLALCVTFAQLVCPVWGAESLRDRLAPHQKRPTLGPTVTGLVAHQEMGMRNLSFAHYPPEPAPPGPCPAPYNFTTGLHSSIDVCFPADGAVGGCHFRSSYRLPSSSASGCTALDSKSPNPYGLCREAHVVELAVNGGAGSSSPHLPFVATGVQVLDGRPGYPRDPAALIRGFLKRYDDAGGPVLAAIDQKLSAAVDLAQVASPEFARARDHARPAGTWAGFQASWVPDSHVLRVVYYRCLSRPYLWTTDSTEPAIEAGPKPPVEHRCTWNGEFAAEALFPGDGAPPTITEHPVECSLAPF